MPRYRIADSVLGPDFSLGPTRRLGPLTCPYCGDDSADKFNMDGVIVIGRHMVNGGFCYMSRKTIGFVEQPCLFTP